MVKIDAHQHLWRYAQETHPWIGDSMGTLKRDFLPADLKVELEKANYTGCVAVQASQTEEETEFLLEQARMFPFIRGVVGWLDLRDPELEERLKFYSPFSKLKGVRHVVQDEPDDRFLLRDDFLKGISLLAAYHLTYDLLVFPKHLEVACEFVKLFPEQKFVLDHIAKPDIKNSMMDTWSKGINKLAQHENVYCKLSGMVTEASWNGWKYADFVPYLDVVFDVFGTDRLMIGSDWPVCTLAGDYTRVVHIVEKYIARFEIKDQSKILGQNAIDFYHL